MAESVSTVELGDEIAVEVSDKSKSIPVTFSQDRHEKTVDYYSGTFTNASRSEFFWKLYMITGETDPAFGKAKLACSLYRLTSYPSSWNDSRQRS
jgi:hypothetical protein